MYHEKYIKKYTIMKCLLLSLLFSLVLSTASAQQIQEPAKKNTVFLELGGNAVLYSLNYDRIVLEKPKWKLSGRIGAMYFRERTNYLDKDYSLDVAVPIELSYLRGKGNHYLEFGLGMTPWYENYISLMETLDGTHIKHIGVVGFSRLGYRYQKRDGGIFFKAGFTPMIQFKDKVYKYNDDISIMEWAGLAVGYTLKK